MPITPQLPIDRAPQLLLNQGLLLIPDIPRLACLPVTSVYLFKV